MTVLPSISAVAVTLFTKPKPRDELNGLVWGMSVSDTAGVIVGRGQSWWESPMILGLGAVVLATALTVVFF